MQAAYQKLCVAYQKAFWTCNHNTRAAEFKEVVQGLFLRVLVVVDGDGGSIGRMMSGTAEGCYAAGGYDDIDGQAAATTFLMFI